MNNIKLEIRRFLNEVAVPGRYVGGEKNSIIKDPGSVSYRMALCYPDVYEIGMSHSGLSVLYHLANAYEDVLCERCFAPWPDMAKRMKDNDIPLFSLETASALKTFDMVGFSLQHELLYTNVLYMLGLAGIPFTSADRGDDYPIIAAGGFGAHAPEPMADVVDIFLPGDGEVTLPQVIDLFKQCKADGLPKKEMLKEAVKKMTFAYVPSFYRPEHDENGSLSGMTRLLDEAPRTIRPGVLEGFEQFPIPAAPVQPGIRCVHDRITLEIMRGCTRGCRFCQAGMIKRPVRTRSPETLLKAAGKVYADTGYDEISLCSLSSSDYPHLERMMNLFNDKFAPLKVGLSLPSLRVRDNLKEIPGLAAAVRKAGITLAPEAATDRLRKKINKNTTNEDLEQGVLNAYKLGWRRVKLYFMIGLPGETEKDVLAIAHMAKRISMLRKRVSQGPAHVNVSVSTFVPKAHTPFQWCPMSSKEEIKEKHGILLGAGLPKHVRLRFHDASMSFVEGVLARGGRDLYPVIEAAFKNGCCFDAWKDHFSEALWDKAFEEAGIDPKPDLHRERMPKELFPWDHIDPGPSRNFLRNEYTRSQTGEATPFCLGRQCNNCGVDPVLCEIQEEKRRQQSAALHEKRMCAAPSAPQTDPRRMD